jgi:hypothetical protein
MRRSRRWVCPIGIGLSTFLGIGDSVADEVPSALRGKSVIVAWSDARQIKDPFGHEKSTVQNSAIKVYVSGVGRIFSQFDRRAGSQSTSITQVSAKEKNWDLHWHFDNQQLIADWPFTKGARRLSINFANNFNSCAIDVIHAKEAGSNAITYKDMNNGEIYEIEAIHVASTSCTIQSENVFANPR